MLVSAMMKPSEQNAQTMMDHVGFEWWGEAVGPS